MWKEIWLNLKKIGVLFIHWICSMKSEIWKVPSFLEKKVMWPYSLFHKIVIVKIVSNYFHVSKMLVLCCTWLRIKCRIIFNFFVLNIYNLYWIHQRPNLFNYLLFAYKFINMLNMHNLLCPKKAKRYIIAWGR